jgi:hypothetical protein
MGIAIDNCDERRCERYELGLGEHGVERYKFWKQLMLGTMKREIIEWQRRELL